MDVTTHPSISPAKRPRRRWWRLLFPLALLLLIGWWWSTLPKSYHRVARSTTAHITLVPCRQGYLTIEAGDAFVLRDWTTGAEKWRVRSTVSSSAMADACGDLWSIGEHGDVFATNEWHRQGTRVTIWRDGVQIFHRMMLTQTRNCEYGIRVLNDNRVMVWSQDPNNAAVLIDGTKIAARGNLEPRTSGLPFGWVMVAPDGRHAATMIFPATHTAAVTIRDDRILTTKRTVLSAPISTESYPPYGAIPDLLCGGRFLSDGKIYGIGGPLPGHGKWATDTITPGGVWVFQSQGKQGRVYAPSTGDQWTLTTPGPCQGGDATMDGRWALAHFSPGQDAAVSRLVEALQQIPGLENFPNPANADFLGLYERPGKLRALLKVDIDNWVSDLDLSVENYWWFPSPDGHGYVINIFDGTRGACVLFRW